MYFHFHHLFIIDNLLKSRTKIAAASLQIEIHLDLNDIALSPKSQIGIIKVNLSWFACRTNRNRKSALGANTTKNGKKKTSFTITKLHEIPAKCLHFAR